MSKHYITTPIGTAVLPFLFEEDKEYGGFKIAIRVDKKTAEVFKAKLLDTLKNEEFKSKTPHIPIVADEKNEGMYLIRTSSKYQPAVFDSKNKSLSANTKVGGGSEVRAIAEAYKYEVQKKEGIKLRLKQVQVIKLAEGGGGFSGFDQIDDGYEADDSAPSFSQETEVSALDL